MSRPRLPSSSASPRQASRRATACLAFAVLACAAAPAAAQTALPFPGSTAGGERSTPHLRLVAYTSPATATPGQKATLSVEITPKRGMRVYAPGQAEYIPVSLTLDPNPVVLASGAPQLPKPVTHVFAPTGEKSLVYDAPFRIDQPLTVAATPAARRAATAAGASLTITGRLEYQACDDTVCYKPQTVPLSWTLGLAAEAARPGKSAK